MNDNDLIKEKLKVLDEIEVPDSVSPAVLMAKLQDKKTEKKSVFRLPIIKRVALIAAAVALFVVGAFAIGRQNVPSIEFPTVTSEVENVRFFKSNKEIIDAVKPYRSSDMDLFGDFIDTAKDFVAAEGLAMNDAEAAGSADDFSTTNVQVEGVLEADTAITDGKYIYTYRAEAGSIAIVDATDKASMKKVSEIKIEQAYGNEFYVAGDKLVVNCSKDGKTGVMIYDITDREKPVLFSEFSQDGYYNTSRLIGDTMYLVSVKGSYHICYDGFGDLFRRKDDIIPCIEVNGVNKKIPAESICVIGEPSGAQFTVISAVNVKSGEPVNTMSIMGRTNTVYCSAENLYLTREEGGGATTVTKISLNGGSFDICAQGEVRGRLLNQFSLDEYNGNLRLVTTAYVEHEDGDKWIYDTENNVYILGDKLKPIASIEHLAIGERIYSARFMGGKIYMVTFKETDPLFVIDASDPTAPKVLGELKIPGFSNYLHPYGENMLIGFGRDVEYNEEFDSTKDKGIKLSLFDVSDPTNPIEVDTMTFGNTFCYSEAANNHKAILFDARRSLFGFPLIDQEDDSASFVVVKVSESGLEPLKSVKVDRAVYGLRGLTIGDTLFTISESEISADELFSDLHIGGIEF